MPAPTTESPDKVYPAELRELLEKAAKGDHSLLPEVRKAFDEHPELAARLGDLVKHAEASVLAWGFGDCLTVREAAAREMAAMRARLTKTAGSELEKLLIDRVVISWLDAYAADIYFTDKVPQDSEATPVVQAAQKILDRAHQRFLTASRTLAVIQKLVRPALSPVELLNRAVAETDTGKPAGGRRSPGVRLATAAAN